MYILYIIYMTYTIYILLSIIIFLIYILHSNTINHKELYTTYNDFKYSDTLTIEDIKQIKKGQKKMSHMIKVFDTICQKNNIRYFLIGGSLIGALAYKGWIPWDGDIDLEVHEDDYPKLKNLLQTELPKNMWFQDHSTDKYYPKNNNIIGKVRDLNSCYIEYTNNGGTQWHNGLQIDINIYKEDDNGKISFPDNTKVDYLTTNDVYPLKRVPFEDFHVNVMKHSEKYLVNNYSSNWMKDLPVKDRFPHEGKMDGENTCSFHYEKYPNLYK